MVKLKMVVVEIEAPRWVKRTVAAAMAGALALVASAVVRADVNVKTDFQPNELLTAAHLNTNFENLKKAVDSLQKQAVAVNATSGKQYSINGTFAGVTKGSYTGQLAATTDTGLGYAKAKEICEAEYGATAHMCTTEEMVRTMALGISVPLPASKQFRIASGLTLTGQIDPLFYECAGFTSNESTWGSTAWGDGSGAAAPSTVGCATAVPLGCCR